MENQEFIPDYEKYMEYEILQSTMFDKSKKAIPSRWTTKWLDENLDIKNLLEEIQPDTYLRLQAIENVVKIWERQKRYENRKYIYITFFSLLGFAMYDKWGSVIGFLFGFALWYYFQPIKVTERFLKK